MKSKLLLAVLASTLCLAAFPAAGLAVDGEEAPLLTFSPTPVELVKTTAGAESPTQAVDVYNAGGVPLAVDSIAIEGGDSGDFKFQGSSCGWIDPGQQCSVSVSFAPAAPGAKTATLAVKLKEAPEQVVTLQGEAVPAELAFTPASYDFGIQRVNRGEGSGSLQLANEGAAAVQLGWLGISGPDSNNFWTSGGDCWNGRWLAPGESCTVGVGFNPWDPVPYVAALQAHVNGDTFAAALTGHGGRAVVEATVAPVAFAATPVGSPGPVRTIELVNNGNLPASFFIAVIAGGSVGSFQLLDEDCTAAPLAPGASCRARVRFAPQELGVKSARLALFGDDEGGVMVILSGEGLPALSVPAAAGPITGAAALAATVRTQRRRLVRGAGLSASRARCHGAKLCRRAQALRARSAVADR
jgi:hypothetical protein